MENYKCVKKMAKNLCEMRIFSDGTKCNQKLFAKIKVQVIHPPTGRKSWQTWKLCQHHLVDLLNKEGKEYASWYKKKNYHAPVIGLQEPMEVENV